MAKKRLPIHVVTEGDGNPLLRELRQLMDSWKASDIEASLTVDGHDYWWILEYGSGSAAEMPDGELAPPVMPKGGFEIPSGQSQWGIPFKLDPRQKRTGKKAKKRLKFRGPGGAYIYPLSVVVSGQGANKGWIRRAVRRFEGEVAAALAFAETNETGADGPWPVSRENIVNMVNAKLTALLDEIKRGTPLGVTERTDPEHDTGHLVNAWDVTPAR